MARKDGGESEGIVLYPSRSPSLGWKPTPLAPLVRGVKAMRPTRGFSTAPMNERLPTDEGGITCQGGEYAAGIFPLRGFLNNPSSVRIDPQGSDSLLSSVDNSSPGSDSATYPFHRGSPVAFVRHSGECRNPEPMRVETFRNFITFLIERE